MPKILVLFLLICQISFSQTKEETIEWLNLKLEHYGDNDFMGTYQIETKNDSEIGEYLLFTKKSWNPFLERNTYEYYTVKPGIISSIYLSGKVRPNETLDIYIKSEYEFIYHNNEREFLREIGIHMKRGNNDMAKRIQTGLLHLFELMGNKIEKTKDLFKN